MTGQRRPDRYLSRLLVANLTQQDYVGILAKYRTQHGREPQPDLLLHLDLVDRRHLVLDWIFDRDDVLGP